MGATLLPSSLPAPRGGAATSSRACPSHLRIDPACVEPASATAAPKKPKRSGSFCDGEPPSKRRRAGEKNGVNRMLLSLLLPGRSPREVIPLPDSVVRVFQENGTRCCGRDGGDEEIEIDVQALGDDALRVIRDRVSAYLQDRASRAGAPKQSKEGVDPRSRSIPSKAASPNGIPPRAAPANNLSKAAPASTHSKIVLPRAAPSLPAPPKPSDSGDSVSELGKTAISQSPSKSAPAPSQPSRSTKSVKEALADAAEVMKEVVRRRELEKLRAAARREIEQMMRTVEFNDPYIDYHDVFK